MQKIKFQNGHHIDLETMNFMQDTYADAINAFAKTSTHKTFIVSGVELSEYKSVDDELIQDVTDGFIVFDGEFMEFRGGRMYPNREENSLTHIVKKKETRTNENSNGQLVGAFEITYATLGNDEEGVSVYSMKKANIVVPYSLSATVTLDERVQVSDNAEGCGFYVKTDTYEITPRCSVNGNIVYMYGAVTHKNKDNSPFDDDIAILGVIPDWADKIGQRVYIKCLFRFTNDYGQNITGPGCVYIQKDGTVQFTTKGYKSRINNVIFDGTPTFII